MGQDGVCVFNPVVLGMHPAALICIFMFWMHVLHRWMHFGMAASHGIFFSGIFIVLGFLAGLQWATAVLGSALLVKHFCLPCDFKVDKASEQPLQANKSCELELASCSSPKVISTGSESLSSGIL